MKTNLLLRANVLIGAAFLLMNIKGNGAPLTWFPGPALISPMSGAAAVVDGSYGNVVIGGDGYIYPEHLTVTNQYWQPLSVPLYGAFIAAGAAANGDMITVYGGTDGSTSQSTAIDYSPSDVSVPLASMSVARAYLGYTADAGGNAYAIGGLDDSGNPLASAESFNQDTTAWSAIASLPAAQYDFPAVFDHTNRIYIFGGRTNSTAGTEIASALYYSVSGNNWTAVAPLPIATAGSAAAFGADGKIYVVGGVSGGVTTNVVQVYDPASNTWTVSTPLPEALSASAVSVDSLGRLMVMGGMDGNSNDVADVWRSQQLGTPDSAPIFIQYPMTNAVYSNMYSSTISATGNPQPTYLLVNGPAGMQVDTYSGAITWTPLGLAEVGSIPVTIRATNYAGSVDWNFIITVPNPPPTIPANFTVVSATDNSVTFSWNAENPIAGPATYALAIPHPYHSPRGSGGGINYQVIATNLTSTNLTISGLAPSSSITLCVNATTASGTSAFSGSVAGFTTGPQGPTNLWVTMVTSTSVGLAWTPSPGPADNPLFSPIISYTIMERNMSVYPYSNVPTVTNILGTNGIITGLKPGSSHLWFVSGIDASGNASPLGAVYVVVANPPPALLSATTTTAVTSGGFQFSASQPGTVNQTVTIQATTDPADPGSWVTIGSVLVSGNSFTFTDTNAALYPNRFYRVITP